MSQRRWLLQPSRRVQSNDKKIVLRQIHVLGGLGHQATEIIYSSEEFRILQQILCDRESGGYPPDTRRDIVTFGSMSKMLDPGPTCALTEETFRCRLQKFAFPSVHADLDDRYDGDLDDVRVHYRERCFAERC